ncbi:hypothetical protein ACLBX9_12410 [Methylobacterium sp. A49B]
MRGPAGLRRQPTRDHRPWLRDVRKARAVCEKLHPCGELDCSIATAEIVGNTLLRQPRIKLTRMINRASDNPFKIPLRKAQMWYDRLTPSEAFSFRTGFLLIWTMIFSMAAYGVADLVAP